MTSRPANPIGILDTLIKIILQNTERFSNSLQYLDKMPDKECNLQAFMSHVSKIVIQVLLVTSRNPTGIYGPSPDVIEAKVDFPKADQFCYPAMAKSEKSWPS